MLRVPPEDPRWDLDALMSERALCDAISGFSVDVDRRSAAEKVAQRSQINRERTHHQ